MRIHMIETMSSDKQTWLATEEYDFPDNIGKQLIASKAGKEVKPKAKPADPKPIVDPKPEEKKPEPKKDEPATPEKK